jgi:hypothetical protein
MPMSYTLVIEPFDCWEFDFMGPFSPLKGYTHILLAVDYVTKWVEVMTHKYRGSQQSSREVLPKFIDSTQGEPKNICKP